MCIWDLNWWTCLLVNCTQCDLPSAVCYLRWCKVSGLSENFEALYPHPTRPDWFLATTTHDHVLWMLQFWVGIYVQRTFCSWFRLFKVRLNKAPHPVSGIVVLWIQCTIDTAFVYYQDLLVPNDRHLSRIVPIDNDLEWKLIHGTSLRVCFHDFCFSIW